MQTSPARCCLWVWGKLLHFLLQEGPLQPATPHPSHTCPFLGGSRAQLHSREQEDIFVGFCFCWCLFQGHAWCWGGTGPRLEDHLLPCSEPPLRERNDEEL